MVNVLGENTCKGMPNVTEWEECMEEEMVE